MPALVAMGRRDRGDQSGRTASRFGFCQALLTCRDVRQWTGDEEPTICMAGKHAASMEPAACCPTRCCSKKVRDIVGLYVDPPEHEAGFSGSSSAAGAPESDSAPKGSSPWPRPANRFVPAVRPSAMGRH